MAINFDIDSYRQQFLGGARAYLFYAFFNFPGSTGIEDTSTPYLVKSTQLPEIMTEEVRVPYTDYDLRTAGIQTYGDWTVTMNVDENGDILYKFYDWLDLCTYAVPNDYMKEQKIFLLNSSGESVLSYTLYGAWPRTMSSVSLDYSSNDIAAVEISFAFQWIYVEQLSAASSITSAVKSAIGKSSTLSSAYGSAKSAVSSAYSSASSKISSMFD